MDDAPPVCSPYLGMAVEDPHRITTPFSKNQLLYVPTAYHPLTIQHYSIYTGHQIQRNAPPPPPASRMLASRSHNSSEFINAYSKSRDCSIQQGDINHVSITYLERQFDVADRTSGRPNDYSFRVDDSHEFRYQPQGVYSWHDFYRKHGSSDRHATYDYRDHHHDVSVEAESRYSYNDRRDSRRGDLKNRMRHDISPQRYFSDRCRDYNRSNYDRFESRRVQGSTPYRQFQEVSPDLTNKRMRF